MRARGLGLWPADILVQRDENPDTGARALLLLRKLYWPAT